jgi:hypothetical protein
MQRDHPPLDGQNSEPVAAVQHVFPKAAVRNGWKGRNPNRPFAAGMIVVSIADKLDLGQFRSCWYYLSIQYRTLGANYAKGFP